MTARPLDYMQIQEPHGGSMADLSWNCQIALGEMPCMDHER